MSFRITDTSAIDALRSAYNAGNWPQAYQAFLNVVTVLQEVPLTDPLTGVQTGTSLAVAVTVS